MPVKLLKTEWFESELRFRNFSKTFELQFGVRTHI